MKLFSKIKLTPHYKSEKKTAPAPAIAPVKAGHTLFPCNKEDIIVEYFILHRHYNVLDINMALFDHDQLLLGG